MTGIPDTEPTRESALAVIDVCLRRSEIAESLRRGPKDKRELVEAVGVSRSTVDRATRDLEAAGVIEYADGRFAPTPLGEFVAGAVSDLVETVQVGRRLDEFLRWVPAGALDIDPQSLADAEITVPEPGNPYNMVNRHIRGLRDADSVRAVLPLTGLHAVEAAHAAVVDDGADYEFVVIPDVADTYASNPDYAPLCDEMLETGRFDLFVYDGEVPYYLGLLDGTVQIGVDEDGEPRALLESDAGAVRDWAERTYREYRENAERATPP